jgi:hypothetical protein
MNTDKHRYNAIYANRLPLSAENQKRSKRDRNRGKSVPIGENQWLIKEEKKFGMGSWVIREYQWELVAN